MCLPAGVKMTCYESTFCCSVLLFIPDLCRLVANWFDKYVKWKPIDFCIKVTKGGDNINAEELPVNVMSKSHWKDVELAIGDFLIGLHIDRESLKSSGVCPLFVRYLLLFLMRFSLCAAAERCSSLAAAVQAQQDARGRFVSLAEHGQR